MTEQELIAKIAALADAVGPDDWIMWPRPDESYDWTKNHTAQDALNDLLRAFDAYRAKPEANDNRPTILQQAARLLRGRVMT
jgi:hypothetical protein